MPMRAFARARWQFSAAVSSAQRPQEARGTLRAAVPYEYSTRMKYTHNTELRVATKNSTFQLSDSKLLTTSQTKARQREVRQAQKCQSCEKVKVLSCACHS